MWFWTNIKKYKTEHGSAHLFFQPSEHSHAVPTWRRGWKRQDLIRCWGKEREVYKWSPCDTAVCHFLRIPGYFISLGLSSPSHNTKSVDNINPFKVTKNLGFRNLNNYHKSNC